MLSPSAAVIVPASHAVGCALPVMHAEPAGHAVQSSGPVAPSVLRYEPAAHIKAAVAPSAQCEPAGQAMQAVACLSGWYVPAAQFSQALWPSRAANEPGLQVIGAIARAKQ